MEIDFFQNRTFYRSTLIQLKTVHNVPIEKLAEIYLSNFYSGPLPGLVHKYILWKKLYFESDIHTLKVLPCFRLASLHIEGILFFSLL